MKYSMITLLCVLLAILMLILLAGCGSASPVEPGAIAFTFDDANLTVYTAAFPALARYGYKATFYVTTGMIEQPGQVTREQLAELKDAGWVIGSHTVTHPHLPQLSRAEQEAEMRGSRQWLIDNGLGPAQHFSYPFGEHNFITRDIARVSYDTAVRTKDRKCTLPITDPYTITRRGLGPDTKSVMAGVKKGQLQVLLTHNISPGGDLTAAEFQEIVDYANELGLRVVTMQEVLDEMCQ